MSNSQKTVGRNPLEVAVSPQKKASKAVNPDYVRKEVVTKVTLRMSSSVLERAKNAVYWSHGLTLRSLIDHALEREVALLEKERGEPFPERSGELQPGRPLS